MDTSIEDNTKKERAALPKERAPLSKAESDFMEAQKAFKPLQASLDNARRVHKDCWDKYQDSVRNVMASKFAFSISEAEIQSRINDQSKNFASLGTAEDALKKIETRDTLAKEATYKRCKTLLDNQNRSIPTR
jgi:hypothetical protein